MMIMMTAMMMMLICLIILRCSVSYVRVLGLCAVTCNTLSCNQWSAWSACLEQSSAGRWELRMPELQTTTARK